MKAAQINEYGDLEVVKLNENAEKPQPGPGQVLVEVYAAGVNPFDNSVRSGRARSMKELEFPATLGGDVAGVVAGLGEAVEGVKVGDEVYGQARALSGNGSFAEYTPVNATSLSPKPTSVGFIEGAALPLAGTSAYQALVDTLHLQPGQKILIHGGAGGIGSIAVQLAKNLGAYVATTAAGKDLDFVTELDADQVINYETQDFSALLKDYDAVFDTVGGETLSKSFKVLRPGGKLVTMKGDSEAIPPNNIEVVKQSSHVTTERLSKLAELVDAGLLKVKVDKVFSLEEASEALGYLQNGHPRGKVVIKVKN